MLKYVLKRVGYMLFVFVILSVLFFFIYNSIPGDPAKRDLIDVAGKISAEQYEERYQALRDKYGLDENMFIRYGKWMWNIMRGDFGYSSFYKMDVIEFLPIPMSRTVFINIFNLFLVMAITIPLGIMCAVKRNSIFDRGLQIFTIVGYSTPAFVLCLIVIFLFSAGWTTWFGAPLFPPSGWTTAGATFANKFEEFKDTMWHLTLPLFVMTISSLGGMTRYVRAAMIDALNTDYVRTARSKGLREKVVVYSHAWRNALLPVITLIIGWFLGVFGGSLVIENTFSLLGMGRTYIQALYNQDYNMAMAIQTFYMVISLVGNLLIDLSYGLVDPRVRITK